MEDIVAGILSNLSRLAGAEGMLVESGEAVMPTGSPISEGNGTRSGGLIVEDQVIVPLLWGTIILIGLLGNGLVVYVMLRYGERQTTNCYIVNLAFTDLAFVLIVVPFTMLHYVMHHWMYGVFMCKFALYMSYVSKTIVIHIMPIRH